MPTTIHFLRKKITPKELRKLEGFNLKKSCIETVKLNHSFRELNIQNVIEEVSLEELIEIEKNSHITERKLGVSELPAPFGKGLEVLKKIKAGEKIPYGGKVVQDADTDLSSLSDCSYNLEVLDYKYKGVRSDIILNGKEHGTLARYCSHFPTNDTEYYKKNDIITANVIIKNYVAVVAKRNGTYVGVENSKTIKILAVFEFITDLEPGEHVGADYGPDFFKQSGFDAAYLRHDGTLFSKNQLSSIPIKNQTTTLQKTGGTYWNLEPQIKTSSEEKRRSLRFNNSKPIPEDKSQNNLDGFKLDEFKNDQEEPLIQIKIPKARNPRKKRLNLLTIKDEKTLIDNPSQNVLSFDNQTITSKKNETYWDLEPQKKLISQKNRISRAQKSAEISRASTRRLGLFTTDNKSQDKEEGKETTVTNKMMT